jgi:hypothetical protein
VAPEPQAVLNPLTSAALVLVGTVPDVPSAPAPATAAPGAGPGIGSPQ